MVQRCPPAGRGGHDASAHQRPPPTTRRRAGKAHPSSMSLKFTSARASTSLWTIVGWPQSTANPKAVRPQLRTAGPAEGVRPDKGFPRMGTRNNRPSHWYDGSLEELPHGARVKAPEWPIKRGDSGES
jgi:hypothetical protein